MNKIGPILAPLRANGSNGHDGNGEGSHHDLPIAEAQELTTLFLAVARQLLSVDDQAAELPLRQLRVCMTLFEGPRAMSSLSRELGVSQSAMTQIADRLERARLVRRSFEGTDRRVRSLQLTPRGQRMMQLREEARVERAATVVAEMSGDERGEVLSALRRLLAACGRVNGESSGSVKGSDKLKIRT
jgi:DNA-binding MarR family transcriptional regulator